MAPGWMTTWEAEKFSAMGKVKGSMIFTEPPSTAIGCWRDQWYVKLLLPVMAPAGPVRFCSAMFWGAGVPLKMYNWSLGMLSKADALVCMFLLRTSMGLRSIISVTKKVASSLNCPLSKTSRNSVPISRACRL